MKRNFIILLIIVALFSMEGCGNQTKKNISLHDTDSVEAIAIPDTTVYGVCGESTSMHNLELITDMGDTLEYALLDEGEKLSVVKGGLLAGDRMAVIGRGNQEHIASQVINLTTLLGRWNSLDRSFEIFEGGVVKSSMKAETNPWTSWKINNGHLVLNKDTFSIYNLGADSLYLENKAGIFTFKRQ